MLQRPPDSFFTTFDTPLQDLLVGAVDRAYDAVAETHQTHPGYNKRTFGFNVYEVGVHELSAVADENSDRLQVQWSGQTFRLLAGSYEIAYHKVGDSADDDIRFKFPNNDGAVTSMVLTPFLPGFAPDLSQASKLVLAHMGNPQDGLSALYLCIPVGHGANGKINEWGFTYEILRRKDDAAIAASPAASDLAPDEPIEELDVTPVKRERKPRA